MVDPRDELHLSLQRILLGWDYTSQEVAHDRSDLLQMFIAFLSAGLAAVASVLLERVPALPGFAFAAIMFGGAAYAQRRRRVLRKWLRRSAQVAMESIETLKKDGER